MSEYEFLLETKDELEAAIRVSEIKCKHNREKLEIVKQMLAEHHGRAESEETAREN